MSAHTDICQLAQNLARNCGYAVFPCKEDKSPATRHGFQDATNDPDKIPDLWRRWSGPLVGVATGTASGISVLDVDVKADEARVWWRQNERRIPATRTYRTRSAGLHLVFRHAAGVKCAVGRPTPGIDARGAGGYIIFWFAHGFDCIDHTPPATWPAWLSDYFWPPKPPQVSRGHDNSQPIGDPRAALDGIVRCVRDAQELTRNSKLYWAAHRMTERISANEITKADARRLLTDAAKDAGLDAIEIERTLNSAWRVA